MDRSNPGQARIIRVQGRCNSGQSRHEPIDRRFHPMRPAQQSLNLVPFANHKGGATSLKQRGVTRDQTITGDCWAEIVLAGFGQTPNVMYHPAIVTDTVTNITIIVTTYRWGRFSREKSCSKSGPMSDYPDELGGRWRGGVVLKRDVFSTIERGRFRTDNGEIDAVLRRIDGVPWWSRVLAHELFRRERKALARAKPLGIAPPLLLAGRRVLVRGWIDGVPLHIAKPYGDAGYFRSAKAALRKLHRAGIAHNDLAKEQNWLYAYGRAYLTDFQLAACFRRRSGLFRLARYEDLRHLLKHKRRYAPDALTAAERRVLARKSFITRAWMATGKKVYYAITRGLNITDREGRGMRFVREAPVIAARLRSHPRVRDVAIVPYPDRRAGTGLYAFVEGNAADGELITFLGADGPEHLQVVDALPRNAQGEVRSEILELVAMNQLDLIAPLIKSDAERAIVGRIVSERRNLRDRFSF